MDAWGTCQAERGLRRGGEQGRFPSPEVVGWLADWTPLCNDIIMTLMVKKPEMARKPRVERKTELLQVRLPKGLKREFEQAAQRQGLDLSSWVRTTLLRAARKG